MYSTLLIPGISLAADAPVLASSPSPRDRTTSRTTDPSYGSYKISHGRMYIIKIIDRTINSDWGSNNG